MKKVTVSILSIGVLSMLALPTANANTNYLSEQDVLGEIKSLEQEYGLEITVKEGVGTFISNDPEQMKLEIEEFEKSLKIVDALSSSDNHFEIDVNDDTVDLLSGTDQKTQIFDFDFTEFDLDLPVQQVWRFTYEWVTGPPAAGRTFSSIFNIETSIQGIDAPITWDHNRSQRVSWANVGGAAQGGANLESMGDWRVTGNVSGFEIGATVADTWTATVTANR